MRLLLGAIACVMFANSLLAQDVLYDYINQLGLVACSATDNTPCALTGMSDSLIPQGADDAYFQLTESSVIAPQNVAVFEKGMQPDGAYPSHCYAVHMMVYGNDWSNQRWQDSAGTWNATTRFAAATGYRLGSSAGEPCGPWLQANRIWARGSTSPVEQGRPLAVLHATSYDSCLTGEDVTSAPVRSSEQPPPLPEGAISVHGIGPNDTTIRRTFPRGVVTTYLDDVSRENVWPRPAICDNPPESGTSGGSGGATCQPGTICNCKPTPYRRCVEP